MKDLIHQINTIKTATELLKMGKLTPYEEQRLMDTIKENADKISEAIKGATNGLPERTNMFEPL